MKKPAGNQKMKLKQLKPAGIQKKPGIQTKPVEAVEPEDARRDPDRRDLRARFAVLPSSGAHHRTQIVRLRPPGKTLPFLRHGFEVRPFEDSSLRMRGATHLRDCDSGN